MPAAAPAAAAAAAAAACRSRAHPHPRPPCLPDAPFPTPSQKFHAPPGPEIPPDTVAQGAAFDYAEYREERVGWAGVGAVHRRVSRVGMAAAGRLPARCPQPPTPNPALRRAEACRWRLPALPCTLPPPPGQDRDAADAASRAAAEAAGEAVGGLRSTGAWQGCALLCRLLCCHARGACMPAALKSLCPSSAYMGMCMHVQRPPRSRHALHLQARCWARRRPRQPRAPPTPRAPPPTRLLTSGAAASMGAGVQGGAAAGATVPRCRWRRTRAQRRLAICPTPPHTHPPRHTLPPSNPRPQLLRPHRRHRRGPPAERGGAERGGARVGRRGRRRREGARGAGGVRGLGFWCLVSTFEVQKSWVGGQGTLSQAGNWTAHRKGSGSPGWSFGCGCLPPGAPVGGLPPGRRSAADRPRPQPWLVAGCSGSNM